MYVARVDAEIMSSDEVHKLREEYRERFGERFVPFNYADFEGTKEKPAAQIYKETLEKALREGKPYRIKSKQGEFFGH